MDTPEGTRPFNTRPLYEEDLPIRFDCGHKSLNAFLMKHALGNSVAGVGKTYVLPAVSKTDKESTILGYYTLSMADVESRVVQSVQGGQLPRYPLSVALIGRMAVDKRSQGVGIGSQLLKDALLRIHHVSQQIGCMGVICDAKDNLAHSFYVRFGFVEVDAPGWPRKMFLPMKTLLVALNGKT